MIKQVRSTPHARGSTVKQFEIPYHLAVYPACAGIHHSTFAWQIRICRLPRMRGDPPRGRRS